MSILRKHRVDNIRCFLVRPVGQFTPTNWRQRPERFQIVRRVADTARIGKADALKWLHNHAAIQDGTASQSWFVTMK